MRFSESDKKHENVAQFCADSAFVQLQESLTDCLKARGSEARGL